jgi:hypothetical protein
LTICLTSAAIDANTVALWHFNEGSGQIVDDVTGNGHDGILGSTDKKDNNDPEWIAEGYAGSALEFSGGQSVIIQNDGSFDLSEGTIELWFKLKEPIQGAVPWNQMIGKTVNDNFNSYLGIGDNPPGKLRFKMEKGGDDVSVASDSNQWNADQWYFVAGTFGPDGLKLYIDGVLQGNTSQSRNSWADIKTDSIGIGFDMWPGNPDYFRGIIDEVRISNIARQPNELGDYTAAAIEPMDKAAATWAGIKAGY